jgi:hypothetical protein
VGQYVNRGGKTYYKADDGKLYKNYNDALAVANQPQTGYEYGLSLLGVRPDRSAMSGLEYGMQQLKGLAGTPGKPETGLQYGLQLAGNLFNRVGRGASAATIPAAVPPAAKPPMPGLPADNYKEDELAAGLAAQKFRYGAGLPGQQTLVFGVDSSGNVDRSQSDEYKSQMAQYRNLISQKKEQEAEDLGMKIWMQKYGGKLGLTGPNPLMQETANAPSGFGTFVPTQGATPAVLQASEAPLKDDGQVVKTYFAGAGPEGFSPLDAQDQQQEATAAQADMATTVKLPVRDRVAQLRSQVLGGY